MSAWECEEPILKRVRFEKKFTRHYFETLLSPSNEHPTDDLTYLSRYTPIAVVVHDTLSKESVYLVDKKPKRLIKRFIEALTSQAQRNF